MKGIVSLFLCFCFLSLSGCEKTDDRKAAYDKAELALKNSVKNRPDYQALAIIYESLGDFNDSREKSAQCWYAHGKINMNEAQYFGRWEIVVKGSTSVNKGLEYNGKAKEAFERASGYKDAVKLADDATKEIDRLSVWGTLHAALDTEDYDRAIPLLESLEHQNPRVPEILQQAREKRDARIEAKAFKTYIENSNLSGFTINPKISIKQNLDQLLSSPPFEGNSEKIAEVLAGLRAYDVIAQGWNGHLRHERKLNFKNEKFQTKLDRDTLLITMIKLAESGDESQEFNELLTLMHSIVVSPNSTIREDPLRWYANLLNIHEPGPEWIDILFPNHPLFQDYKKPGTMDYRIVHAPQRIKDALFNPATDLTNESHNYTKAFTPQEAKKLFKGFIPSKPLGIGYIYIVDEGTLPEKSFFPELLRHNYASTARKVTVSYEPKEKHHPRKDYDKTTKTWTERKGDTGLIEELIQQKGDFFCVANPNNARIAIYEKYSYHRHGAYQVEGRRDKVTIFLPTVQITVVDLISGKTLFTDTVKAEANRQYEVPGWIKEGDTYTPFSFFDRSAYLAVKLKGLF